MLETRNFYPLYPAKLSLANLYSITRSSLQYAIPVKDSVGDLLKATIIQLDTDNQAMYNALNRSTKSGLTPMLRIKGEERREYFNEIKRNIKTDSKGSDVQKHAAGKALLLFMETYWDTDKMPMNTATGIFSLMIERFNADETIKTHAVTLEIADLIVKLDTVNKEFDSLYKTRNTQEAANTKPSASSLKPQLARSYDQYCNALQQAVNYIPTDVLIDLFNQTDELRLKYARLAQKPKEEPESDTVAPVAE